MLGPSRQWTRCTGALSIKYFIEDGRRRASHGGTSAMGMGAAVIDVIKTKQLGDTVGAEVVDVDRDRLLHDDDLPMACLEALDANGVLLFRELHMDDATQVAFCRRLGEVVAVPDHPIPEITVVSLNPENNLAQYLQGAFLWHLDGSMDEIPSKASVMTAHATAESGGDTEFASTYAAYDGLSAEEKERYGDLRVVHTFEATQRQIYPDPTPEQLADWDTRPPRTHPLVWEHIRAAGRSSSAQRHRTSSGWTATRAAPCSRTSWRGRPLPGGCSVIPGRWATPSSGTTEG